MNDAILWALLGTIFGGSGLAIINKLLNLGKDKFDIAKAIREELRIDIKRYQDEAAGLRVEVGKLRDEVDIWRKKYFELDEQHEKDLNAMQEDMEKLKRLLSQNGISYTTVINNMPPGKEK